MRPVLWQIVDWCHTVTYSFVFVMPLLKLIMFLFVISYTVSTIEPCPLLINNYLVLIWYFKDFLDVIL